MKTLIQNSVIAGIVFCNLCLSQDSHAQSGGYYGQSDPYAESERREMERQRMKLDEQRMLLEQERLRIQEGIPAKAVKESCPAGYQPSQNKCSEGERKKGCKDVRLPGGLGCVSR
jgi:hypothetical protein